MRSRQHDLIVVGGGPAGLAAATAARLCGLEQVTLLEREDYLGGILNQCVHDGFGIHLYERSLTGPEYVTLWEREAHNAEVNCITGTSVLSIEKHERSSFHIKAVGSTLLGHATLTARSVVVATGCRERTRGQLGIPGSRPAGVMTAGEAQYLINIKNQLPGDKVVILGTGDIGLIMARRLTLEGAQVKMVLGQEATGLLRNHIRCLQDFELPVRYGWGVVSIHGYGQLHGVTIAPLEADGTFDLSKKEYMRCNLLLLACGLIPERDSIEPGAERASGLFVCGNAKHPHDLVDQVTQEGLRSGIDAARFVGSTSDREKVELPAKYREIIAAQINEPKGRAAEFFKEKLDEERCSGGSAGNLGKAGEEEFIDVCTECPTGCVVRVREEENVEGNACMRGKTAVLADRDKPLRLFTGTIKVQGSRQTLLPVRTASKVPREEVRLIAQACRDCIVEPPVVYGQIVYENVAGSGVDLVATAYLEAESENTRG